MKTNDTLMMHEILEQPAVLERVAAQAVSFCATLAGSISARRPASIHLVGCGDMHFSACAAVALARWTRSATACPLFAHNSMDLRWESTSLTGDDLVIVASFSGRTPRTVEAAARAKRAGARVIAITGNAGSLLDEYVEERDLLCLQTGPADELDQHEYAGYHANVPQTKTYTAVLLAELLLLADLLDDGAWRDELAEIPGLTATLLRTVPETIGSWVARSFDADRRRNLIVLGSGPWRPAAMFGAAKFLEMTIPARHQCLEEFNHLELFLTGEESLVVFLCPDRAAWTRTAELAGPYAELGAQRLALVDGALAEVAAIDGADQIVLPGGPSSSARFFSTAIALQILAAAVGPACGRDIDRWVGGIRTKLIENLSQETIRGSKILRDEVF